MPTRLYFHDAAYSGGGTLPSGKQSARTQDWVTTGGATNRTMDTAIGTAQTSRAGTSTAVATLQRGLLGMFISPPLAGAQTVGGGDMILNAAEAESNLAANFWVNSVTVYVWRPSTGARVGDFVRDTGASGGTEPTAIDSEQVSHLTAVTSTAVSASDGDVIVCEVWGVHTQGVSSAYTCTFYYDGTTVNTTENATVSNHASFIEFSETLVFAGPSQSLTPSLFTDADAFYTQVLASTYSLTPALYSDADTFPTLTVSTTYALTPGLYDDADTFYTATISAAYTLTPGLLENSTSVYTPSVVSGGSPQGLTPGLFASTPTFYAPSVGNVAKTIFAGLVVNVSVFYTQGVAREDAYIAPIPTSRPKFKSKDWSEVVNEADPSPHTYINYQFSNGRKFKG